MIYSKEHLTSLLNQLEGIQMTVNHLEDLEEIENESLSLLFYKSKEKELSELINHIQNEVNR